MNRRPKNYARLGRWRTCSLAATENAMVCRPTLEDAAGLRLVKGPKVTATSEVSYYYVLQLFAKKLEGLGEF